jgi:predicted PurR-regulated permease PerM
VNLGQAIGFFAFIVSLYILWQIRAILFLVFIAVVFAIALNRVVQRFRQSGVKRGVAIAITVGIFFTILALCLIGIIIPLYNQSDQLFDSITIGIGQLRELSERLQAIIPGNVLENIPSLDDLSIRLQQIVNWIVIHLYQVLSNSLALLLNALLIVVLTIMLLVNPKQYRRAFIQIFPAFYRHRVNEILSKCEVSLVNYVLGIALSMTFIGVTSTIGLAVLKVPLPLVNGLLAGLSAFIPYIGAIASAIPPMLLALLISPWKALEVLILYFVIQQIEGNCVTPIIMKNQVSLMPATTLALLTAFGSLFGFLGLFAALPIIVVAQVWLKEVLVKDILDRWQTNPLR